MPLILKENYLSQLLLVWKKQRWSTQGSRCCLLLPINNSLLEVVINSTGLQHGRLNFFLYPYRKFLIHRFIFAAYFHIIWSEHQRFSQERVHNILLKELHTNSASRSEMPVFQGSVTVKFNRFSRKAFVATWYSSYRAPFHQLRILWNFCLWSMPPEEQVLTRW